MIPLAHSVTLTGANGRIWGEIPVPGQAGLVTVIQTPSSNLSTSVRLQSLSIAAFDGRAELLATVTNKGDTYIFNIPQNRYVRVSRTGHAGTAAAFSTVSIRQLFVGYAVRPCMRLCSWAHASPPTGLKDFCHTGLLHQGF